MCFFSCYSVFFLYILFSIFFFSFFFFSSRRRHTRFLPVSWARHHGIDGARKARDRHRLVRQYELHGLQLRLSGALRQVARRGLLVLLPAELPAHAHVLG